MTERLHALGIDDVVIPLTWEESVAACLAKEGDRRPVSAREVAASLGLIEGVKPAAPVPSNRLRASEPSPPRRRPQDVGAPETSVSTLAGCHGRAPRQNLVAWES